MKNIRSRGGVFLGFLIILVINTSCSNQKPRDININQDICAYCKMGITDTRFASELITAKGKVYKFDSIECLAAFYRQMNQHKKGNAKLWVHNFLLPKQWLNAKSAIFIKSDKIRSPMSLNLLAVANDSEMTNIQRQFDGKRIKWSDLQDYVKQNMK